MVCVKTPLGQGSKCQKVGGVQKDGILHSNKTEDRERKWGGSKLVKENGEVKMSVIAGELVEYVS